ncbi:protein YELLOW LEAF 1, choloroplastic-like [Neltuma alba]|uniref:protein YELLOW LEAF 1, choloroplastic-like n=1 Tax=Neltuma alba TaxID=207710 RepID=UPI0010A533B2|nr:protein YELLOW LEAF 1, choloroplastic-like [Prosopis alba]XP_028776105.1 protein YELLOW LEAF 1, choloroplastic-like [Prosopis alba]
MSMTATTLVSLRELPPVRRGGYAAETNVTRFNLPRFGLQCYPYDSKRELQKTNHSGVLKCTHVLYNTRSPHARTATVICAAALNARCGAEQTQTVTRQAPTMTHIPGKEKSPQLDDGGTGFPPRDDGDGGGGGGGGGGNWSGGFFFFGFLAFLGFLKDRESEGSYRDNRRRR